MAGNNELVLSDLTNKIAIVQNFCWNFKNEIDRILERTPKRKATGQHNWLQDGKKKIN